MNALPVEIILHIATFLTPSSLAAVILTCKTFANYFTKQLYDEGLRGQKGEDGIIVTAWSRYHRAESSLWRYAKHWKSALISDYFSNMPLDITPAELGWTWTHKFAYLGNLHLLQLFVARGMDIEAKNSNNRTPLFLATFGNKVDTIRFLLDAGADMYYNTYPHPSGLSSFELAMESWPVEVARLFIEAGADVNIGIKQWRDRTYRKPLHIAAKASSAPVVELLLAHGADPFSYTEYEGARETALHIASRNGDVETCQHLVNAIKAASHSPPSIYLLGDRGNCPLTFAEEQEVVDFLIEAGKSQPCRNCAVKPFKPPEKRAALRPSNCRFDSRLP